MSLKKGLWLDLTSLMIANYLIELCRDKPVSEQTTLFVFTAFCFYRIMSFLDKK